jgi:hypothetical protein
MGWVAFGATLFALLLLALAGLLWQEARDLRRLQASPVYVLDDAVEHVTAQLGDEADPEDVRRILERGMLYLQRPDQAAVAGSAAAVAHVVEALGGTVQPGLVVRAFAHEAEYLAVIGAIGAPVEEEST